MTPEKARQTERVFVGCGATSPLGMLTQAGINHLCPPEQDRRMRILGRYSLVYLWSGTGLYRDTNGHEQRLQAGDCVTLFPELGHLYGGDDWHEIYLIFEGPVFDAWRQAGLLSSHRPIGHLEPTDYWFRHFRQILTLCQRPSVDNTLRAIAATQMLIAELAAGTPRRGDDQSAWLLQAQALLAEDFAAPLLLADVAREMGLSYETFRKRFVRIAGEAPGAYRQRLRIEYACTQLRTTDLPLKAIAATLGYGDEFHFSRCFRKRMGVAPGRFRQR